MPNDSRVSALDVIVTLNGLDLLHLVDDPLGTPVNKKASLNLLFGGVPCNTSIVGTFAVSGNTTLNGRTVTHNANGVHNATETFRRSVVIANTYLQIANTATPANSTQTLGGKGTLSWDATYLYMETADSVIKRIAWASF